MNHNSDNYHSQCVSVLMDTKKMILNNALIANLIGEKKCTHVNIKMLMMVCGLMVNNVMMVTMTQEMVAIIFK